MPSVHVYAHTETGYARKNNEDHVLVGQKVKNQGRLNAEFALDTPDSSLLAAVADGIGGSEGGEVASLLALQALARRFYQVPVVSLKARLLEALAAANQAVMEQAQADRSLAEMGCTLSGVCLQGAELWMFHCGDSRVYRYSSRLRQLSRDDTVAEMAVQWGRMTPVGDSRCNFAFRKLPALQAGERLLVSSDGLHDLIPPHQLAELASQAGKLQNIGKHLAEAALGHGGDDNISLILIEPA
jgi:protein phosphatase